MTEINKNKYRTPPGWYITPLYNRLFCFIITQSIGVVHDMV